MKSKYLSDATIFLAMCLAILLPSKVSSLDTSGIPTGQELFNNHCSACHGPEAVGQDPSQPPGGWDENSNRLAPALNGTGHAWHHPPSLLFQYIKKGSIDENSPMPAFGDQLNDDEIQSIISYIQSLWPDEIMKKYNERFKDKKE